MTEFVKGSVPAEEMIRPADIGEAVALPAAAVPGVRRAGDRLPAARTRSSRRRGGRSPSTALSTQRASTTCADRRRRRRAPGRSTTWSTVVARPGVDRARVARSAWRPGWRVRARAAPRALGGGAGGRGAAVPPPAGSVPRAGGRARRPPVRAAAGASGAAPPPRRAGRRGAAGRPPRRSARRTRASRRPASCGVGGLRAAATRGQLRAVEGLAERAEAAEPAAAEADGQRGGDDRRRGRPARRPRHRRCCVATAEAGPCGIAMVSASNRSYRSRSACTCVGCPSPARCCWPSSA